MEEKTDKKHMEVYSKARDFNFFYLYFAKNCTLA